MPALRVVLLVLSSLAVAAAAEEPSFNLGPLGAEGLPQKAVDGVPKGTSGIRVTSVIDGAPAKAAGLAPGDVLVGVGTQLFSNPKLNPVYQLVDLLEKASSKKDPKVTLAVVRGGKKQSLPIVLPSLDPHAAGCPIGCARCDKLVEESLKYIASKQRSDGGYDARYSSTNGEVVMASLSGLAWLASGSTPKEGPYAENLRKAVDFVGKNCGRAATPEELSGFPAGNWNQTNWGYAYASVFLSQVYPIDPSDELKAKLEAMSAAITQGQEASGGWAHGPGGPNALGYVELQIVGNWCLCGLGALKRAGIKVQQSTIDRGVAYSVSTSSGDGGVGYSHRPGQKGNGEPGRTSGCIWAFSLLGLQKHAFYPKMSAFFKGSTGNIPSGHISPVMHFLTSAFASTHLGSASWRQYMELFRLEVLATRGQDGHFRAQPTEAGKTSVRNLDHEMGPVWTTANYALILQLPKGKLPLLAGTLGK